MVLDAILGDFSLVNVRKIVTKPRILGICRLVINRHQTTIGAIRRFVVIPKLLAGVLPLGIDFASICHLARIGIGIGLSKGVVCRARAGGRVAKTLQQARMGKNRIALLAGQADLLKLCRHLIGICIVAQASKQT